MNEQVALQRILQSKLTALRAKNPAYSIRAFSRRTGVTAGTLSLILLGKRKASKKLVLKIAEHLALDPQERSELLDSFPRPRRKGHSSGSVDLSYLQMSADQFRVIGEWHYFAILNLINIKEFKGEISWIARRLGISETVARDALERLKRLGMIKEESGSITRCSPRYRTSDDIASLSLRRSHHQTLELSRESLDRDPVEYRDFTWVTFAMDKKKLSQAKELIRKFQDDLIDILDQDAVQDEVYRLAIQLFPLTKLERTSE